MLAMVELLGARPFIGFSQVGVGDTHGKGVALATPLGDCSPDVVGSDGQRLTLTLGLGRGHRLGLLDHGGRRTLLGLVDQALQDTRERALAELSELGLHGAELLDAEGHDVGRGGVAEALLHRVHVAAHILVGRVRLVQHREVDVQPEHRHPAARTLNLGTRGLEVEHLLLVFRPPGNTAGDEPVVELEERADAVGAVDVGVPAPGVAIEGDDVVALLVLGLGDRDGGAVLLADGLDLGMVLDGDGLAVGRANEQAVATSEEAERG